MKKIFVIIVLISLLLGNLAYSQGQNDKKEEKNLNFKFISPKTKKIKGEVKIKGKVKNADSIEFFYQSRVNSSPIYLGRAQKKDQEIWELVWDTNSTPNGEYQLFAEIISEHGQYKSAIMEVEIENKIVEEPEEIENLENEHQETKKSIEKTETEIEQTEESAKTEFSQVANEEEKEDLKEVIEEFFENVREETQIEIKIKKTEGEKAGKEKVVKDLAENLKEIQNIPDEKARIIIDGTKARLEIESSEYEGKEKEIDTLQKELEKKRNKKEEFKKEIIRKIKQGKRGIISNKIEQLEKEVKEREKEKIEKEYILVKDSDRDDLSDEFEISIGTNPFYPDSDIDGFLDGIEYQLGYNPLKPGGADKIVYSDAKKAKPKKSDIYYIERVTKITLSTGQTGIKIEGKGLANSFVTIYIYSSPIVMVTKTDENGNWSITLDKPLADGLHEVYTTVTNNYGEITTRSEPFVFEKSGERIVAITVSSFLTEKTASPIQNYQINFIVLMLILSILAVGIAIIIIGVSVKKIKGRK